jgi:hypothetical protein
MSYDNLSSVSRNVLKFYQQFIGAERRVPLIWKEFNIKFYATTINDKTPEQPNEIILIIYFNFRRSLINHSSVTSQ